MKSSRILLNIMSVICFIYGALYVFTLVFIPLGVYCFIAGRRFSFKAEHLDDTMYMSNYHFKCYVIFVSIVCFPLGLLSIVPYLYLTTHNIKVSNFENNSHNSDVQVTEPEREIFDSKEKNFENNEIENNSTEVEVVKPQKEEEMTEEEKLSKFRKLQNFRDKGIITDEELELAKEQLFGKDKK